MTFKELADKILALPPAEQQAEAVVWPPGQCPAAETVSITGIERLPVKQLVPVLSTGKKPA